MTERAGNRVKQAKGSNEKPPGAAPQGPRPQAFTGPRRTDLSLADRARLRPAVCDFTASPTAAVYAPAHCE
jgi:hypothetical protein